MPSTVADLLADPPSCSDDEPFDLSDHGAGTSDEDSYEVDDFNSDDENNTDFVETDELGTVPDCIAVSGMWNSFWVEAGNPDLERWSRPMTAAAHAASQPGGNGLSRELAAVLYADYGICTLRTLVKQTLPTVEQCNGVAALLNTSMTSWASANDEQTHWTGRSFVADETRHLVLQRPLSKSKVHAAWVLINANAYAVYITLHALEREEGTFDNVEAYMIKRGMFLETFVHTKVTEKLTEAMKKLKISAACFAPYEDVLPL